MKNKFKLGQQVYQATFSTSDDNITCPDCGGTGRICVIFHDDTRASIDCGNCASGYNPPTGKIRIYRRMPLATPSTIVRYEIGEKEIVYHLENAYRVLESDLFLTQKEAMQRAQKMCDVENAKEMQKILTKEKDTRSWAWNASYHRREITNHEKRIEYHKSKLAVASLKSKDGEIVK